MPRKPSMYDQNCYNLAIIFLADHYKGHSVEQMAKFSDDLARHIQIAIEDWFSSQGIS